MTGIVYSDTPIVGSMLFDIGDIADEGGAIEYSATDVVNTLYGSYKFDVPKLVAMARTYLGVPFKHRGRDRRGVDCAGLVWCACADAGVIHPDLKRYGREPHRYGMMRVVVEAAGEPLWQGRPGQVVPREVLEVGDVVVMRFVKEPHHMGIIGPDRLRGLSLIHANAQIDDAQGPRVVEHGLDELWQSRICAVFRGAA